jgi:hypothetical protein
MSGLTFNVPINAVSFGQVSTALLRESREREMSPLLFPIGGGIDLSSQKPNDAFKEWVGAAVTKAHEKHSRDDKTFKLWHLNGGLDSPSKDHLLMTFYELDSPTKTEINVLKNVRVAVSSLYTKEVFESVGCECSYIPLFFDSYNFHRTDKKYFDDDRITFNICGKFEQRKHHDKILKAWVKEFGDNTKYHLQCTLFNTFLNTEDNNKLLMNALEGRRYSNVSFLNFMKENSLYNDYLNSSEIIIGMSGGEGWGLPEFQSLCLGKHAVILNAHAYKDWANDENAVLVEPSGKISAIDGLFFHQDAPYNQGSIFNWEEKAFIDGCHAAIDRVKSNPVNEKGLALVEKFTVSNTLDKILELV